MSVPNINRNLSLRNNMPRTNAVSSNGTTLSLRFNKGSTRSIIMLVITIVVAVLLVYGLYTMIRNYNNTFKNEPWLIHGTRSARNPLRIAGSKIPLSVDQKNGIEFTYSFWMYINDYNYKRDSFKHILHKGSQTGRPLQSPGFWLTPKENRLNINMNTYYSIKESCDVGNIPIGKWVNVIAVIINKNIDVYINGQLKKRCKFKGLPKQNFGDIYITNWQGFDGFLSQVRYFNYAIPFFKVEQILKQGPSSAPCPLTGETPPYLAEDYWLTTGFPGLTESDTKKK